MRLIDADALMECKFKNDIGYNAFCNLVKRQETIDAVHVVRCKECKYAERVYDKNYELSWLICINHDAETVESTDYCSYGERREVTE